MRTKFECFKAQNLETIKLRFQEYSFSANSYVYPQPFKKKIVPKFSIHSGNSMKST